MTKFLEFILISLLTLTSCSALNWANTYKIESQCSKIMCRACPVDGSELGIDKNTALMKENNYIISLEASTFWTSYKIIKNFELDSCKANPTIINLFERDYMATLSEEGIEFESPENSDCSFFAKKVIVSSIPYDAVANVDSILGLANKGWDIWIRNNSDYNMKAARDTIVVGMAGPFNVGKSFILSQAANQKFLSGFDTHTIGLSIKYAEFLNRVATYLDTAGFETPMTFYSPEDHLFMQKFTSLNMTVDEVKELKLKDRHITEHFLQNFILEKSDIILLVVGQMTFSDQKLINRVLKIYGNSTKEILIIHNFFHLNETKQVLDQIETDIKGSFNVKVAPLELDPTGHEGEFFHQEVYINKDYRSVRHVVTANQGSKAGDYFNLPVFHLLKSIIYSKSPKEPFNIVNILASYTKENLRKFANIPDSKEIKVELNKSTNSLVLKNFKDGDVKFKPISVTIDGLLTTNYDLIYNYDFFFNPITNLLVFRVDLPGVKKNSTGARWERGEKYCLIFEAELEENKDIDNNFMVLTQNRKTGKIKVTPPCIDGRIYEVSNQPIVRNFKDGVLTLHYTVNIKPDRLEPIVF